MVRMALHHLTLRRARRGFTLTEIAIVLLAVGGILSAIWVVGGRVWENYRVNRTLQETVSVIGNIRDANTGRYSWAAATDMTQTLDGQSIFPTEMERTPTNVGNTAIDHALNGSFGGGVSPNWGSFHVLSIANPLLGGNVYNVFRISLRGLAASACAKILMQLPLSDAQMGIVQIGVTATGTNSSIIKNGVATAGGVTPMLPTTAESWCASTTSTNEVDLDVKLHN
ncbi:MAG: prepilin-type N-terminal cleavage/methylation domain-containing protein [Alphaproteobacteria bacterium]|nr:prepilin-type N-terminal cleavage/methylation domain-containing protein [Alphaproteobacteria bacterium]